VPVGVNCMAGGHNRRRGTSPANRGFTIRLRCVRLLGNQNRPHAHLKPIDSPRFLSTSRSEPCVMSLAAMVIMLESRESYTARDDEKSAPLGSV